MNLEKLKQSLPGVKIAVALLVTLAVVAVVSGGVALFFFKDGPVQIVFSPHTPTPAQPTMSPTVVITLQPTFTATPQATLSSTPVNTPTPALPMVTTNTDVNIRNGPGMDYAVLGLLRANQTAEVTGLSEDDQWWQIRFPGVSGERAWLSAQFVTAQNADNVPIVLGASLPAPATFTPVPPTATAVPAPTFSPTPTYTPVPLPSPIPTSTPVPPPAQIATPTRPYITHWHGQYWNNRNLRGNPIFERNDREIDFRWGAGSPVPGVSGSDFSVRWSRWIPFQKGKYSLYARADDGVRVFVDGRLVIDQWHSSDGNNVYNVDLNLDGNHWLVVEYYEKAGTALVEFWWDQLTPSNLPTATPTVTTTPTLTPLPTFTLSPTSSLTPIPTVTHSPTFTPTPSHTASPASTPTFTPTSTSTATSVIVTVTPTPTNAVTKTPTATVTPPITPTASLRADFAANPLRGTVPLVVTFTNSSTNASSYRWNFGDGTALQGALPLPLTMTHSYTQAGVFTVTLLAGDGVLTDTLSRKQYITAFDPLAPQADFFATPVSGTVPLTITFTNNSTNAGRLVWNFGNGTLLRSIQPLPVTVTHKYTQAQVYTVTLSAGDGVLTDTWVRPNYINLIKPLPGSNPGGG